MTVYIQCQLKNAPDFELLGMQRLTLLTQWAFFRKQGDERIVNEIDMQTARNAADNASWWAGQEDRPIVFDVETLPVTSNDEPLRDHIHDQLIDLVNLYRNHPLHHYKALGFYANLPRRDFQRAMGNQGPSGIEQWHKENRNYLFNLNDTTLERQQGVASYVDRVYPSLYYWYPDRLSDFEPYADANLHEAAIYKKPIIPFLCPNVQQAGFPFWDAGVWGRMLQFVKDHTLTNGLVIFVIGTGQWDENASWWQETKEVLGV